MSDCQRCALRVGCGQVVWGSGPKNTRLMLVETVPGAEEDLEGEPLVGRWKRLLDKLLTDAQIEPTSVYRTYLVKCWPRQAVVRDKHIQTCKAWLWQELKITQPKVVVTLGKRPSAALLRSKSTMKLENIVGQFHVVHYMSSLVAPWYSLDHVLKSGESLRRRTISFLSQVRQRIA